MVTLTKSVHVWSVICIKEVDQFCSENVNSFLKKNPEFNFNIKLNIVIRTFK